MTRESIYLKNTNFKGEGEIFNLLSDIFQNRLCQEPIPRNIQTLVLSKLSATVIGSSLRDVIDICDKQHFNLMDTN